MPKPTLELPDIPDSWLDAAPVTPSEAPENSTPADPAQIQDGILDGWQPKDWNMEDSGIHAVLNPETVADIDFTAGTVGGQNPDAAADPHAITEREPTIPSIRPVDIDARLPNLDAGPDHRFYSAAGGTVTDAGWENSHNHNQGYGYRVRVRGDNGMLFTYGHSDPGSAQVHVGDKVTTGQHLGSYGDPTNGRSTGPHTHLEVRDPSQPLQPEYNAFIHNSRALGMVVNPAPYIETVMPGGAVKSKFGFRDLNGKREFHPGVDLNRKQ